MIWEWIRDSGIQAEIEVRHDGMTSGGDFGAVNKLIKKKPLREATFRAEGLTDAESQAIFDLVEAGDLEYTLTDYLGNSWTGIIRSWTEKPVGIAGTIYLEGELVLIDAVKT